MTNRRVALDLPGGPGFVSALRRVWDDGDAALPIDPRLPAPARTPDEELPVIVQRSMNPRMAFAPALGNGVVNVDDLLAVIGGWGACGQPCSSCLADTNGDCVVNVDDLLAVVAAWGPCP